MTDREQNILSSRLFILIFAVILALASFLFSLSQGTHNELEQIILQLRLPRTLAAFTCGGLLALAGTLMQLLLQNPLADPYILGISGGAATCTLLFILCGVNEVWLPFGAWLGSSATILFIFLLAKQHRWQSQNLLLAGIALASGFSACISVILTLSTETSLASMLFWLNGDLNVIDIPWASIIIFIVGFFLCLLLAPLFNILARGDRNAHALGVAIKPYRLLLFILASLFTATAVTLAGSIGFIGLIMPHLTRRLIGFDHAIMLPVCVLLSGSLLTCADTLARLLIAPEQLPVGILITFLGVPTFIWLLRK